MQLDTSERRADPAFNQTVHPFRETNGFDHLLTSHPAMYYLADSDKSFEQASSDLEASVKRNGFGVLHIHDLGSTLRSKGIDFKPQCRVFEVCNPLQAAKVLATDMRLNMALPCRISVFTENGQTRIGMIKPGEMLASLSQDPALAKIAKEVEEKTIQMIDEAK
ncbi:MAG: DUF302 domain-containing protein [Verrucomicrobiales bacterium]